MKIIHGIDQIKPQDGPCVATIGNFDGVHLGHQHVVASLLKAAKLRQLPSTVITFEPLAREYFAPESIVRITSLQQRCDDLATLGVDQVLVIDFDSTLVELTAQEFLQQILIDGLDIKYLSVGDDFKFGKNRQGDFEFLQKAGAEYGLDVENHQTFMIDGERVSSGRVRAAVLESDFEQVASLLGRPYAISGKVELGQQLGRTIGFPTANIVLDRDNYAVRGVYAVYVTLESKETYWGVANVGNRPTVDGTQNRLEVHIFQYSGDLYEQSIQVRFHKKIRDERKFESFELLKQQIHKDAETALSYLQSSAAK